MKKVQKANSEKALWLNADNPDDRELLNQINSSRAIELFKPQSLVIIDEAQRLENSGLTLKIIHDSCQEIQLVATGSSAFAAKPPFQTSAYIFPLRESVQSSPISSFRHELTRRTAPRKDIIMNILFLIFLFFLLLIVFGISNS